MLKSLNANQKQGRSIKHEQTLKKPKRLGSNALSIRKSFREDQNGSIGFEVAAAMCYKSFSGQKSQFQQQHSIKSPGCIISDENKPKDTQQMNIKKQRSHSSYKVNKLSQEYNQKSENIKDRDVWRSFDQNRFDKKYENKHFVKAKLERDHGDFKHKSIDLQHLKINNNCSHSDSISKCKNNADSEHYEDESPSNKPNTSQLSSVSPSKLNQDGLPKDQSSDVACPERYPDQNKQQQLLNQQYLSHSLSINKSFNKIPCPVPSRDIKFSKRNRKFSLNQTKKKSSQKKYSSQSDTGIQISQNFDRSALLGIFQKHIDQKLQNYEKNQDQGNVKNMNQLDLEQKQLVDFPKEPSSLMIDFFAKTCVLHDENKFQKYCQIFDILCSMCLLFDNQNNLALQGLWVSILYRIITNKTQYGSFLDNVFQIYQYYHLQTAAMILIIGTLIALLMAITWVNQMMLQELINSLWLLQIIRIYITYQQDMTSFTKTLKDPQIACLFFLLYQHSLNQQSRTQNPIIYSIKIVTFLMTLSQSLICQLKQQGTECNKQNALVAHNMPVKEVLELLQQEIQEFKLSLDLKNVNMKTRPLQGLYDSHNSGKRDQKLSSQTDNENNHDDQIMELRNSNQRESIIDRRTETMLDVINKKYNQNNKSLTENSIQNQCQQQIESVIMKNIGKHVMVFNLNKNTNTNEQIAFFSDTEQLNYKFSNLKVVNNDLDQSLKAATIDQHQNKHGLSQIKKLNKKNQLNLNFIKISVNFFEDLPFYKQIELIFSQKNNKQQVVKQRSSNEEQLLMYSRDEVKLIIDMEQHNNSQILNGSLVKSQNQSKNSCNQSNNQQKQRQSVQDNNPNQNQYQSQIMQNNKSKKTLKKKPLQRAKAQPNSDIEQSNYPFKDLNASNNKENNKESTNSFIDLTKMQREMMDLKIFEPYFINNTTKLVYQEKIQYFSINDILKKCTKNFDKKRTTRLFFKVYLNDYIVIHLINNQSQSKKVRLTNSKPNRTDSNHHLSKNQNLSSSLYTDQFKNIGGDQQRDRRPMSKVDQPNFREFDFSCELDLNKTLEYESQSSISSKFKDIDKFNYQFDDQVNYFEFEITHIGQIPKGQTTIDNTFILNIKDVTNLVKSQQRLSDSIYQQAIESNFSHQYMTPLNFLTSSQDMINDKVIQMFKQNQVVFKEIMESLEFSFDMETFISELQDRFASLQCKNIAVTKELMKITDQNNQSAFSLWFLNQTQIKKMQIHQNKFQPKITIIDNISNKINKVFEYFIQKIKTKNLNVYIAYRDILDIQLKADWDNFGLVLFNIIQNAIQYNYQNGDLLLIITRKKHKKKHSQVQKVDPPLQQTEIQQVQRFSNSQNEVQLGEQDQILEIEVIDTGEGISPERQNQLFLPLMQSGHLQGLINKSKNNNMSFGLSASRQIIRELKGDLIVKHSEQGLTIFQMRFPVRALPQKIRKQSLINLQNQQNNSIQSEEDNHESESSQIVEQVGQYSSNDNHYGPSGTSLEMNRGSQFNQVAVISSSSEPEQPSQCSQYESSILPQNTKVMQLFGIRRRNYKPQLYGYLMRNFNLLSKQKVYFSSLESMVLKNLGYHQMIEQASELQTGNKVIPRFVSVSSERLSYHPSVLNSEHDADDIDADDNDENDDSVSRSGSQIQASSASIDQYQNLISRINNNDISQNNLAQLKQRLINNEVLCNENSYQSEILIERSSSRNQSNIQRNLPDQQNSRSQPLSQISQVGISQQINPVQHRKVISMRSNRNRQLSSSHRNDSLVYSDSNQQEQVKFKFQKLKSRTIDKLHPKGIDILKVPSLQRQLKFELFYNNKKHPLLKFCQQKLAPQVVNNNNNQLVSNVNQKNNINKKILSNNCQQEMAGNQQLQQQNQLQLQNCNNFANQNNGNNDLQNDQVLDQPAIQPADQPAEQPIEQPPLDSLPLVDRSQEPAPRSSLDPENQLDDQIEQPYDQIGEDRQINDEDLCNLINNDDNVRSISISGGNEANQININQQLSLQNKNQKISNDQFNQLQVQNKNGQNGNQERGLSPLTANNLSNYRYSIDIDIDKSYDSFQEDDALFIKSLKFLPKQSKKKKQSRNGHNNQSNSRGASGNRAACDNSVGQNGSSDGLFRNLVGSREPLSREFSSRKQGSRSIRGESSRGASGCPLPKKHRKSKKKGPPPKRSSRVVGLDLSNGSGQGENDYVGQLRQANPNEYQGVQQHQAVRNDRSQSNQIHQVSDNRQISQQKGILLDPIVSKPQKEVNPQSKCKSGSKHNQGKSKFQNRNEQNKNDQIGFQGQIEEVNHRSDQLQNLDDSGFQKNGRDQQQIEQVGNSHNNQNIYGNGQDQMEILNPNPFCNDCDQIIDKNQINSGSSKLKQQKSLKKKKNSSKNKIEQQENLLKYNQRGQRRSPIQDNGENDNAKNRRKPSNSSEDHECHSKSKSPNSSKEPHGKRSSNSIVSNNWQMQHAVASDSKIKKRRKTLQKNSQSYPRRNQYPNYEEEKEGPPQSSLAEYAQEKMPALYFNQVGGILQQNSSKQSQNLRKIGYNRSVRQLMDQRNSMNMDHMNGVRGNLDDVQFQKPNNQSEMQIQQDINSASPGQIKNKNQSNQKLFGYKNFNIKRNFNMGPEYHSEVVCKCVPKILVVDDNECNLEIQSYLIQKQIDTIMGEDSPQKVVISNANDGIVAVDLIKNQLSQPCKCQNRIYRLIIMDLQMRDMHGDEATKLIMQLITSENERMSREWPHIRESDLKLTCNIVICTANTSKLMLDEARQCGAVNLINKPLLKDDANTILQNWFFDSSFFSNYFQQHNGQNQQNL